MGEQDISLKIGLESEDVAAGVAEVEKELADLGESGAASGAKASEGMDALTAATDRAQESIRKVIEAPDVSALQTALKRAEGDLKSFREASEAMAGSLSGPVVAANRAAADSMEALIRSAEKSGTTLRAAGDEAGNASQRMKELAAVNKEVAESQKRDTEEQAAADKARAERAKATAKETEEAGVAAKKAGKDFQWFKGILGQVAGAMGLLAAAIKIVQQTDAAMKGVLERWGAYRDKVEAARTTQEKFVQAQAAIEKGLITEGKTVLETVAKWDSYIANLLRAQDTTNKAAEGMGLTVPKSLAQVTVEFSKFNAVMVAAEGEGRLEQFAVKNEARAKALRDEYRLLGERVPADLEKVIRAADEYSKAQGRIEEARKRAENAGQAQLEALTREWEARQKMVGQAREIIAASVEEALATGNYAEATAKADKALEALAKQNGISKEQLDKYLVSAIEFEKTMAKTAAANATVTSSELAKAQAMAFGRDALQQQVAAYDQLAAATARSRAEQSAANNFTSPETAPDLKRIQDAAVGAAAAAGQFGTNLDQVAKTVVATGGTLVVGETKLLQYARATEEVTKALLDAAVASKALRAEQALALDATKGWTDYVIGLKKGYDDGVTSLGTYIQSLIAFKSQISQMFAGATGDAREAVTALQDLVDGLMANIGGRDPGSGNRMLDLLNKAIAANKGKK